MHNHKRTIIKFYLFVSMRMTEFGPVYKTTNPNDFKNLINSLTASGGGDLPEMSLSGLQVRSFIVLKMLLQLKSGKV